jgi:GNAT superfamily N-acetyltransferase
MNYELHPVSAAQANAASAVVHASFVGLAAADWAPQAQEAFLAESSPHALAEKLSSAAYAVAAFSSHRMVGFLLMPSPSLLGMLFVHPQFLRQGIARALWEQARTFIEASHPQSKTIELNATPYAVRFYEMIGFVPISAEFRREGCRATRMACWLPARALGAECALAIPLS